MFDLASQFQQADEIVIAAPYWDLSFPAILKLYLENIYVTGVFRNIPKQAGRTACAWRESSGM